MITRLKEQHELFQDKLTQFEPVLSSYGFSFEKLNHNNDSEMSIETIRHCYVNKENSLELNFIFSIDREQTQNIRLDFEMFNAQRENFDFTQYQQQRGQNVQMRFLANEQFEANVVKFFSGIKDAFATYLNDQITGKKFEDHRNKTLDVFYRSGAVQSMQKQALSDAIAEREVSPKNSFLGRLVGLFKR